MSTTEYTTTSTPALAKIATIPSQTTKEWASEGGMTTVWDRNHDTPLKKTWDTIYEQHCHYQPSSKILEIGNSEQGHSGKREDILEEELWHLGLGNTPKCKRTLSSTNESEPSHQRLPQSGSGPAGLNTSSPSRGNIQLITIPDPPVITE